MRAHRFDDLTERIASRFSRRTALRGAGAGLTAGAFSSHALAQHVTPLYTPAVDRDGPHPSTDEASAKPAYLFVQPFHGGTWAPRDGADGTYTLTLSGVATQTIYFSDRPERVVGLSPTEQFLDGLGFTSDNPPNAALVAQRQRGDEQEILVIELLNPIYDGDTGTLAYDARVLADYGEHELAHLAQQQDDYEHPESFGDGALFIDDCGDVIVNCARDNTVVGQTSVPQVWSTSVPGGMCRPTPDADTYCDNAYPDQCDEQCMAQPTWED